MIILDLCKAKEFYENYENEKIEKKQTVDSMVFEHRDSDEFNNYWYLTINKKSRSKWQGEYAKHVGAVNIVYSSDGFMNTKDDEGEYIELDQAFPVDMLVLFNELMEKCRIEV